MLLQNLFVVLFATGGFALRCWECRSKYDQNCRDPFHTWNFAPVECSHQMPGASAVCLKILEKGERGTEVNRKCQFLRDERDLLPCATHYPDAEFCEACSYDGCNGASPITTSLFTICLLFIIKYVAIN